MNNRQSLKYLQDLSKSELLTFSQASEWVTNRWRLRIAPSNIAYLVQYGHIRKYKKDGKVLVSKTELEKYYESFRGKRELNWKKQLGEDLNWALSFDHLREKDTTKHVHRLHPYKGKFIPQLVEYFLDTHTDHFKKEVYFEPGDIVLDPFAGSGTTLVQANELGLHAVGIDISPFNILISNVKISRIDIELLKNELDKITRELEIFVKNRPAYRFEQALLEELNQYNKTYFPSPEFKFQIRNKVIKEFQYGQDKEEVFKPTYYKLLKEFSLKVKNETDDNFLDKWFLKPVKEEILFVHDLVRKIENEEVRQAAMIVLSRTMRSCRATTHSDLGTLKRPVYEPYYCRKHKKICKPLFTVWQWWRRYSQDTVQRLAEFERIRTDTYQVALQGDARILPLIEQLDKFHRDLAKLVKQKRIKGIFTSPPYVGLIDYHEQHAYAYELFGLPRYDDREIGPLFRGQGREARQSYVEGISRVLKHMKQYLADDYHVFLVANDKYGLYPEIAEKAGMKIVNRFKRPVLNRVEKNRDAYAEIIFHLKEA